MRRLLFVLALGVLSWFGMGQAQAMTQQEANAACPAYDATYSGSVACADNGTSPCVKPGWATTDPGVGNGIVCGMRTKADGSDGGYVSWVYTISCTPPEIWNQVDKRCMDPSECLAKNDALGNAIMSTDTDTHGCDGGCAMSMGTDYRTTTFGGHTVFTGKMRYTGQACETTTKPPNDPEPECRPIEGMTVCKRPDDKLCGKASNGNYVCWNPGETGEKTEGPTKQKVDAGPNPIPPNLNLPNGDTLTQQSPTVVVQESKPGQPTSTTNITNYNTVHGSNAGPGNDGIGSDPGADDGEADDGEEPSSSGGEGCMSPPTSVGDAVTGMVALQVWRMRCAMDVGENPESHYGDGNGNGEGDPVADDVKSTRTFGQGGFDQSGFGWGSTCPDMPQVELPNGTVFDLDEEGITCDFISLGGWMVLLIAGLACLRILWSA